MSALDFIGIMPLGQWEDAMGRNFAHHDLDGFAGPVFPCTVNGPAAFYRFSAHPKGAGEWWVTEETFSSIYEEARDAVASSRSATTGSEFRRIYRRRLAISLDWNDLENLFRMDVPESSYVVGWSGATKGQPMVSTKEQARLGRPVGGRLAGGMDQLFIEQYAVDWIRKVSI